MDLSYLDLGLISYQKGLEQQLNYHKQAIENGDSAFILLCEHKHVYTFGKSANTNNLLINPAFLERIDAEVYQTDRGGDVTYHGPGQLVGYPILNLRNLGIGVRKYVQILELSLMDTLKTFGISTFQIEGLTGIWVNHERVNKKIAAIGIRVKQGVSMHGFALNVDPDLGYFNHIVPCGIPDKGVVSMTNIFGLIDMEKVKKTFYAIFIDKLTSEVTS